MLWRAGEGMDARVEATQERLPDARTPDGGNAMQTSSKARITRAFF